MTKDITVTNNTNVVQIYTDYRLQPVEIGAGQSKTFKVRSDSGEEMALGQYGSDKISSGGGLAGNWGIIQNTTADDAVLTAKLSSGETRSITLSSGSIFYDNNITRIDVSSGTVMAYKKDI